jgi:hypothetical protein
LLVVSQSLQVGKAVQKQGVVLAARIETAMVLIAKEASVLVGAVLTSAALVLTVVEPRAYFSVP